MMQWKFNNYYVTKLPNTKQSAEAHRRTRLWRTTVRRNESFMHIQKPDS